MAGLGFRLAVDQLKDLNFDLSTLSSKGFKFIKIDAHLLHEVAKGEDALINMNSLKGAMDRQAMDLIVEKIETEEMLVELLDLKIWSCSPKQEKLKHPLLKKYVKKKFYINF